MCCVSCVLCVMIKEKREREREGCWLGGLRSVEEI